MYIPGRNHLDRQHTLTPRAYIPVGYGKVPGAPRSSPPDGDPVSAAIAGVSHELLLRYRQIRRYGFNRQISRAFGISETVWQEVMGGERWMGDTVMAALLHAIYGW